MASNLTNIIAPFGFLIQMADKNVDPQALVPPSLARQETEFLNPGPGTVMGYRKVMFLRAPTSRGRNLNYRFNAEARRPPTPPPPVLVESDSEFEKEPCGDPQCDCRAAE